MSLFAWCVFLFKRGPGLDLGLALYTRYVYLRGGRLRARSTFVIFVSRVSFHTCVSVAWVGGPPLPHSLRDITVFVACCIPVYTCVSQFRRVLTCLIFRAIALPDSSCVRCVFTALASRSVKASIVFRLWRAQFSTSIVCKEGGYFPAVSCAPVVLDLSGIAFPFQCVFV